MTKKVKTAAVRGAPVVEAIFQATFEEIVRVGYAGLGIEEVATRAGVNKTTVYRRWPTKEALVNAALSSVPTQLGPLPDAGSFRADVLEWLKIVIHLCSHPWGRAMLRVALLEDPAHHPALSQADAAWTAYDQTRGLEAIIHRAIARDEIPRTFDRQIFSDAVQGTLALACLSETAPPDQGYVVRLVDGLLTGLLPPAKLAKKKGPAKARKAPAKRASASGSARPRRRTTNT